jgi:hypothetical protein
MPPPRRRPILRLILAPRRPAEDEQEESEEDGGGTSSPDSSQEAINAANTLVAMSRRGREGGQETLPADPDPDPEEVDDDEGERRDSLIIHVGESAEGERSETSIAARIQSRRDAMVLMAFTEEARKRGRDGKSNGRGR